jgi:hypothetical protein
MLQLLVTVQILCWQAGDRRRASGDGGQSTAEYALVLLGAASIALLLVAWATKTDRITKLLDGMVDEVIGRVK